MLLHLVNKAPDSAAFQQCLARQAEDDAIILFEEAIYALQGNALSGVHSKIYVLGADAIARGVNPEVSFGDSNTVPTTIDYAQWVTLSTQYPRSVSWY